MILPRDTVAGGGGGDILLDDDGRTLASYGITGSEEYDDIVPLEMVVVAPLTPQQIEARQQEVYDAANLGDTTRCQTSIQAAKDGGADLNWQNPNKWGQTPVFVAAWKGNDGCLAQLIAAGADVNIFDRLRYTPVFIAAQEGNEGCLSQLIAAGANVDVANQFEQTPVFIAAQERKCGCLSQLIEAGADIDTPDNNGNTPLQVATDYDHASCVALLRDAGAK